MEGKLFEIKIEKKIDIKQLDSQWETVYELNQIRSINSPIKLLKQEMDDILIKRYRELCNENKEEKDLIYYDMIVLNISNNEDNDIDYIIYGTITKDDIRDYQYEPKFLLELYKGYIIEKGE